MIRYETSSPEAEGLYQRHLRSAPSGLAVFLLACLGRKGQSSFPRNAIERWQQDWAFDVNVLQIIAPMTGFRLPSHLAIQRWYPSKLHHPGPVCKVKVNDRWIVVINQPTAHCLNAYIYSHDLQLVHSRMLQGKNLIDFALHPSEDWFVVASETHHKYFNVWVHIYTIGQNDRDMGWSLHDPYSRAMVVVDELGFIYIASFDRLYKYQRDGTYCQPHPMPLCRAIQIDVVKGLLIAHNEQTLAVYSLQHPDVSIELAMFDIHAAEPWRYSCIMTVNRRAGRILLSSFQNVMVLDLKCRVVEIRTDFEFPKEYRTWYNMNILFDVFDGRLRFLYSGGPAEYLTQ